MIIGAAKSASTFLQQCLEQHPDVYLAPGEVPFFESPDYEQSQLSDLSSLFRDRSEQVLGIKRPSYIGRAEAAARIAAHLPEARLVAVLRNPMERAVAHYYHNVRFGLLPALSLNKGLSRILDGGSFLERYPGSKEILECGLYGKYLDLYLEHFPRENILILKHEDLIREPQANINKTLNCLDLPTLEKMSYSNRRPQQVVYSMSRVKVLRLANPFLFTYNSIGSRLQLRSSTPARSAVVRSIGKIDHFLRKLPLREDRLPSKHLCDRLAVYYRADIRRLSSVIGSDLDHWFDWGVQKQIS